LVPTAGTQAVGAAGQAFGASLSEAGVVVQNVLNDQRAQARRTATQQANADGGRALLTSRLALEDARRTVLDDPDIAPAERVEAFATLLAPILDEQLAGLPLEAQGAFQVRMAGQLSDVVRRMGDQAAADIQAERLLTLSNNLELLGREIQTADPAEPGRSGMIRRQLLAEAIEDGTLTQAAADARLRADEDADAVARLGLQIRLTPGLMIERLTDRAFMPELTLDARAALLDEAGRQFDTQLNRRTTLEQEAVRELEAAQDERAEIHRTTLYDPTTPTAMLLQLAEEVNDEAASNAVSDDFQKETLREVRTITEKRRVDPPEDAAQKDRLGIAIEAATRPQDLVSIREEVLATPGLSSETTQSYLRRIATRSEKTHYSNRTSYRAGVRIIAGGAFPVNFEGVIFDQLDNGTKNNLFNALDLYRRRIEQVAATPQGNIAVDSQAETIAREVRAIYFESGARVQHGAAVPEELKGKTQLEQFKAIARMPGNEALKALLGDGVLLRESDETTETILKDTTQAKGAIEAERRAREEGKKNSLSGWINSLFGN